MLSPEKLVNPFHLYDPSLADGFAPKRRKRYLEKQLEAYADYTNCFVKHKDPENYKKLGITQNLLGCGATGVVFKSSVARVVKVTCDAKEAQLSRKLIGKYYEGLVKVFSVTRVKRYNVWLVEMELLRKARYTKHMHAYFERVNNHLTHLGVTYQDWHMGNLMKCPKTGAYKVVDIGGFYSISFLED